MQTNLPRIRERCRSLLETVLQLLFRASFFVVTRGLGDSKDQLQPSGGRLRAVVSDGATLIFAAGKNADESPAGHGAKRQYTGRTALFSKKKH